LREVRQIRIAAALADETRRQREVAQQQQIDRTARIQQAGGIRSLSRADYQKERSAMLRTMRHWRT
jgi:hypothetical protein